MKSIVFLIGCLLIAVPASADYALVQDGRVVQVEPRAFPVAAPMLWVAVPDGLTISPGWTFNGGFKPPVKEAPGGTFEQAIGNDIRFKAIVRALAEEKGKTEGEIIQWLKQKVQ